LAPITRERADGRSHPYFFEGRVREPRLVSELLTSVHLVVGSRFFTPANTVAKLIALLELLQETLLTAGRSLPEKTRAALSSMKVGGQGARMKKELLG
jgi:hypothetical protein